jgi:hypothetical protein
VEVQISTLDIGEWSASRSLLFLSIHWTSGRIYIIYMYVFSHGVRLSPLGTAATVWPIVPVPDDRWWWLCSNRWNANWQGKPKYSERTFPSTTLSATNPTWSDPGSNPGGKPATNRQSYGGLEEEIVCSYWECHCSYSCHIVRFTNRAEIRKGSMRYLTSHGRSERKELRLADCSREEWTVAEPT